MSEIGLLRGLFVVVLNLIALCVREGEGDYNIHGKYKRIRSERSSSSIKESRNLYHLEKDVERYVKKRLIDNVDLNNENLEQRIRNNPEVMEVLLRWRNMYQKEVKEMEETKSTTKKGRTHDVGMNIMESFGLSCDVVDEIAKEQKCEIICENGGTCQNNGIGLFTCLCVKGYTGEFCQYDINECELADFIPCTSDKKCINTPGSYTCTCRDGFAIVDKTQDTCEAILPCDASSCKNGGECIEGDVQKENWTCVCSLGFTGERCETELKGCSGDSCPPNLVCVVIDSEQADHACLPQPTEPEEEFVFVLDLSSNLLFFLFLASAVFILGGFSLYRRCHKKKIACPNECLQVDSTENLIAHEYA